MQFEKFQPCVATSLCIEQKRKFQVGEHEIRCYYQNKNHGVNQKEEARSPIRMHEIDVHCIYAPENKKEQCGTNSDSAEAQVEKYGLQRFSEPLWFIGFKKLVRVQRRL
jgi:hypothetical protein